MRRRVRVGAPGLDSASRLFCILLVMEDYTEEGTVQVDTTIIYIGPFSASTS
jgi:hypothetical protein